MKWPLKYQIMVPMALVMLGTVMGMSVVQAMLAASQKRQQIAQRITDVTRTLARPNFPLTNVVLQQMKGLSGADFVLRSGLGTTTATTREDWTPEQLDQLDRMASPSELQLVEPISIGGQRFFHAEIKIRPRGAASAPVRCTSCTPRMSTCVSCAAQCCHPWGLAVWPSSWLRCWHCSSHHVSVARCVSCASRSAVSLKANFTPSRCRSPGRDSRPGSGCQSDGRDPVGLRTADSSDGTGPPAGSTGRWLSTPTAQFGDRSPHGTRYPSWRMPLGRSSRESGCCHAPAGVDGKVPGQIPGIGHPIATPAGTDRLRGVGSQPAPAGASSGAATAASSCRPTFPTRHCGCRGIPMRWNTWCSIC